MARNYGGLSPYYTAAENTLEQYVPLPFQEMMVASNAIQQRGDKILEQQATTDSMLANIEALAPEHKNYITNVANNFRESQSKLLDKYNGNASDPEFIRESRKAIMQAASDPNFRTVLSANERLKMNDKIARQMAAEGKLYINPEFTGVNADGRLTDEVGNVEYVNTLDKLKEQYSTAYQTMVNDNKGTISNADALNNVKNNTISMLQSQSPEFTRLQQAYMQQGMTQAQANQKIASDISGLDNQFQVKRERDGQYYNYQLALRQDARQAQSHAMQMKEMKAKLAALTGNGQPLTPSGTFVEGAISAQDLNKDKLDLVKEFSKHIDAKGNLSIINKTLQSGAFGTTSGRTLTTNQIAGRNVNDTLKYLREELGWGPKQGSARQVAQAYEKMVKSDNLAPVTYVPGQASIYNGLDRTFGNNFSGAYYYEDGKRKKADDPKIVAELEKNKALLGLSNTNGGSVIFRSQKEGVPVTITVPMDNKTKNILGNTLKIGNILTAYKDNESLQKAVKSNPNQFLVSRNNENYAPRITSNGLRYAQVNENGDFVRGSDKNLNYLPDELVQARINHEYGLLDVNLESTFK